MSKNEEKHKSHVFHFFCWLIELEQLLTRRWKSAFWLIIKHPNALIVRFPFVPIVLLEFLLIHLVCRGNRWIDHFDINFLWNEEAHNRRKWSSNHDAGKAPQSLFLYLMIIIIFRIMHNEHPVLLNLIWITVSDFISCFSPRALLVFNYARWLNRSL